MAEREGDGISNWGDILNFWQGLARQAARGIVTRREVKSGTQRVLVSATIVSARPLHWVVGGRVVSAALIGTRSARKHATLSGSHTSCARGDAGEWNLEGAHKDGCSVMCSV